MELTEALEQLKGLSEDAFETVSAKFTELNEENKQRRIKNKALSDVTQTIAQKFELDSEGDIVSQLDNVIQNKDKKAQDSMSDVEKLSLQVQELNGKFQDQQKIAQENAQKAIIAKRDSLLTSALSESNVSKDLLPVVRDSLEKKVRIDGEKITFSDGENVYDSIKEGVSSFIEKNPSLQTIKNSAGSGEQITGNQTESKVISRDNFGSNLEAIAKGEVMVSG